MISHLKTRLVGAFRGELGFRATFWKYYVLPLVILLAVLMADFAVLMSNLTPEDIYGPDVYGPVDSSVNQTLSTSQMAGAVAIFLVPPIWLLVTFGGGAEVLNAASKEAVGGVSVMAVGLVWIHMIVVMLIILGILASLYLVPPMETIYVPVENTVKTPGDPTLPPAGD